ALASGSGDHAELARLAEAATPGEWELDGHQCLSAPDGTIVVDYSCCSRGEWEANAAYLRAVQPSRTLALLAENAALRAANDVLEVERIGLRSAIFGSHDYDPTLRHGNFIEMARTTEDARRGAVTRATEAERKLAEAEAEAAAWQDRFRRARIALLKVASVALASARGRD
ncbi:MAG TPA: hypothetical protein PL098_00260, partial [Brevundimonas diminuta]|nr:hypothetical protein [Brevundimonas diminuta]HRL23337.1 hypothetical protein [Brevundimonas diminuta]